MTSPYLDRPLRSEAEAKKDMARHTPGPWKIEYDNDGNGSFSEWFTVGPAIVRISSKFSAPNQHVLKQARANAHLIAAAPDLLAALDLLTPHLNDLSGRDVVYEAIKFEAAINQARAAIAKATE